MEALRWILIVAGIVFVLVIYILGKNRRQRDLSSLDEFDSGLQMDSDLPEFSASNLDDFDEGVGEVRVISSGNAYDEIEDDVTDKDGLSGHASSLDDRAGDSASESINENASDNTDQAAANKNPGDIIVVYILPKADQLLDGAQINSAAQALGLHFGEMNIYHYSANGRDIFSLANMLEPGSFDAETIHDLKTSGLTIFMQIKGDDPMDDLTEMLQRSYQLAGLLEARLCNHERKPLTEQDAENYRAQVSQFTVS